MERLKGYTMEKFILALDQGTTSSRAVIFNRAQEIIGFAQEEFTQIYPRAGWIEHDPEELWNSQKKVMEQALANGEISKENIAAIGITNQRETTIVWDKITGKPVYNAIVWQCRRTSDICDQIIEAGFDEYIKKNTGLIVDAYFSATKIKWILDNIDGARERAEEGNLLFGTVDSWLLWKLTDGKVYITDYTNASRTMLFNIRTLQWDDKILEFLNIPKIMLPEVKNSSEVYGYTNLGNKNISIPISGIAGDQQAALFGQKCFNVGDMKNTYGTGCFLLMNTGNKIIESKNGLISTIGIGINNSIEYALEGSVFAAGAIMQWLRDELCLIASVEESEELATLVENSNGIYIVPAFAGLGAPYWDMYARGIITGLTRGANRNHIVRAALEAICYQSKDLINAMYEDMGFRCDSIRVDGGATKNTFLMQFQADILNVDVVRPNNIETTALGAALLAGLAIGFWKNKDEIIGTGWENKIFTPSMTEEELEAKYLGWKNAVRKALKD